jgi:hypothetical protein
MCPHPTTNTRIFEDMVSGVAIPAANGEEFLRRNEPKQSLKKAFPLAKFLITVRVFCSSA